MAGVSDDRQVMRLWWQRITQKHEHQHLIPSSAEEHSNLLKA